MKSAIILHGMPDREEHYKADGQSNSNKHWLPWLQHELIINDILAQTPELPHPYNPIYESWMDVFQRFPLTEETMLVGHSCGAGFLLRFLSETTIKVGKVVLVAPWIDPTGTLKTGFFDFRLDKDLVKRTQGVKLFYSTDDSEDILLGTKRILSEVTGTTEEKYANMGHFCFSDMKTEKFPDLLNYLLS